MFFSSITADYTKMGYPKAIVRALDFLKNTDLKALPGGRHAIEGDMMYANVDDVETKLFKATKPESHRNYVDIQFLMKPLMKGKSIAQKGTTPYSFPLMFIGLCLL